MNPLVSVVIPTVGRPAVRSAVASALQQLWPDGTEVPVEVLVVHDGVDDPPVFTDSRVRVLRTSGRVGASAARNVALAEVTGAFVAFLDDDDLWLPEHLALGVGYLEGRRDVDIYASRALVLRGAHSRIEPVEAMGDRPLVDHLFGADLWRAANRRLLTPTLVVRRAVAARPMDVSLTSWEDVWWLLEAERGGARIHQTAAVTVVVRGSDDRARARDAERDEAAWAARLASVSPEAGGHYLVGMLGRAEARRGRPARVWHWARTAHDAGHPVAWAVVGAELGVGAAISAARHMRGWLGGKAS